MRDRSFLAVCILILVNQLGFGLITPVMPAYARSFNLDPSDIGLVIGSYGFARFIANVPAGQIAERRGRRTVLIIGTLITSIASALIATADSLPQLLAYRLLAGLGAATVITGGQIMVGDIATPANRGRMLSTYQGFFLVGVGLGPTPGGLLADYFGLRAPFIAYAIFSIAACALAMLFIRETKPSEATRAAAAAAVPPGVGMPSSLMGTLFSVPFLLIGFISFAQFVGRTGAIFTVVPLLGREQLHFSASQIGYALTLINVLNMLTIYFSGMFADRFGRKLTIAPAMVVGGLGIALFAYAGSYPMFLLAAAIWGFGYGIAGTSPLAYVADFAPADARARVIGYFRTVSDGGYIVGPIVLGAIADRYGYDLPLLLTAGMIVISGAMFWIFAPEFHRKQNAPPT